MIPGIGITEIFIIVLIVLLIFGPSAIIAWFFFVMGRGRTGDDGPAAEPIDPAIAAARERYARGEINREEFEQIKSTLGY